MSVTRYASALRRPGSDRARLAPFVVLAVLVALLGGFRAPTAQAGSSPTTPIWSTQLDFDNNGTAWSESFFAGLAADGLTTAELNMPWGTIEPAAGTFSFTEWDQSSPTPARPASSSSRSSGRPAGAAAPPRGSTTSRSAAAARRARRPTWWDPTEQSEYFTYVTDTIQNAVEPARRLRRRDPGLRLPRRPVGPQRRRRRLRGRRHQRVPEHVPAADLRHHRHVQLRQRHLVQLVQPGARGRARRRRCSACSRRSGRGACSRPTGS